MLVELIAAGAGAGLAGWFSSRYAWWRPALPWDQPRVLMYHMVSEHRPGARFNKLRVPPEQFAAQVAWLAEHGFTFVFASRLFAPDPLPEKPVCLTFDDGYRDNLLGADPVLAAHGACATLYLVTDRSGEWSTKKKAHHAGGELRSEPKLGDEEVRAMLASGRWELGAHTRTHANLAAIEADEAREEIASSRHEFESAFGVVPATFAYPFGIYDPCHPPMISEAGYAGAFTTGPGIAPHPFPAPMEVPRVKVSGKDSLFAFTLRMKGGKRGLHT